MTNAVKVKRMVMRSRTGHITEQQEMVGHQGSWIEESRRSLDRDPRLNQPHTPLYSFHPLGIMKSLCVAPQGNRRIECVRDEIRDWKYGNQKEVRKSSCLRRAHNRLDFRPLTWLTTERWIRVAAHPPCPVLQPQIQRKVEQTVFMAFRKDDAVELKLQKYLIELGGKLVLCSNPSENLLAHKHNRPGLPKSHHRAPLFSTIFLQHFSTNKSSTDHLKLTLSNQISK